MCLCFFGLDSNVTDTKLLLLLFPLQQHLPLKFASNFDLQHTIELDLIQPQYEVKFCKTVGNNENYICRETN